MKRRQLSLLAAPLLVLLALLAQPARVQAGGFYLTDRGARALGRGGAFVAGADDGQSLWYNPAGLSDAGRRQLQLEGTLTLLRASFQRVTSDDVNEPAPKVAADPQLLPNPTLAYTDNFGLKKLSFGLLAMAPNAVVLRWPETAGTGSDGLSRPGPTRYSLVSMEGSALAHLALGAAYRPIPGLSIGLGVHVIFARLHAGLYLSACDYGVLCRQEEQRDYEAPAVVRLDRAVTASPIVGLIYRWRKVRIGASWMLFHDVRGTGKLDAKLPNTPIFGPSGACETRAEQRANPSCARIVGDKVDVKLAFPMVARVGLELRPTDRLRLEVGASYEGWSRQQEFRATPRDVRIENAAAIPSYEIGPLVVPRHMRDVYSVRVGAEYTLRSVPLALRAGALLENGAFPSRFLTPLTLDSDKCLVGAGLSYAVFEKVWIDVLYAHVFMREVRVRDSAVYPQNPLRPPPPADGDPLASPAPVGNGNYAMEADLVGLGMRMNM